MDTVIAKGANGATDPGLVSALAEDVVVTSVEVPAEETPKAVLNAAAGSTGPEVKLNFVNRSNDTSNVRIVVFGQQPTPASDQVDQAWQVISNCGPGWSHPFAWPAAVTLGVVDPDGNVSPQLAIADGQVAEVVATEVGTVLRLAEQPGAPGSIGLINLLPRGRTDVTVFRAGKPYARASQWPQTRVVFSFRPIIWIGVAARAEEGDGAVISNFDTEISLMGLASADIVLTGGGSGPDAKPFVFRLENMVQA